MPHVTGFVRLPHPLDALVRSRLHIRVEEVGRSDAPARLLGSTSIDTVSPRELRSGWVPFGLDVADPGPGDCAIRAHLDIDRTGIVKPGDYVTTEHIPVLDDRQKVPLLVAVEPVRRR